MRWPKGFACNNNLFRSKDLIPRVLMVAAAHTPCQGGCILVTEKMSKLSRPKEDSAREDVPSTIFSGSAHMDVIFDCTIF